MMKNTPFINCDCHKIASRYSGQRARCTAGRPASPAAYRRRTPPRAAPRSQRRRRPGGAAVPAHAAWSSHRPAPRAPDDVPDDTALALHGREAVDPSRVPAANHVARCSAKPAEEVVRRCCRARARGWAFAPARTARVRRLPRRFRAHAARSGSRRAQPRAVGEPRRALLRETGGGGGQVVLPDPHG